jgi:hypothetical protein
MIYEVKFFNHGGHVFSTTRLPADDDRQAIELAQQRFHCGIGHCYEIWCDGRLVHNELLDPPMGGQGDGAACLHGRLVRSSVEQALACSDLQQRRLLMMFAEKLLGYSVGRRGSDAKPFKLVLNGERGRVIAELDIPVASSNEAFAVASILADACSGSCTRFELWFGPALQGSASGPFCLPEQLSELSCAIVLAREIMLHETCKTIAESDRLLRKIYAGFGSGMAMCA